MQDGLIDVHHHARPQAFFDTLAETGRNTMGGRPFPPGWTAGKALALMDRMRIATALLSAPDADLLYRDRPIALKLSRLMNELFADSMAAHPSRFGAFASLPMPHIDDALDEAAFALDELKLDGRDALDQLRWSLPREPIIHAAFRRIQTGADAWRLFIR